MSYVLYKFGYDVEGKKMSDEVKSGIAEKRAAKHAETQKLQAAKDEKNKRKFRLQASASEDAKTAKPRPRTPPRNNGVIHVGAVVVLVRIRDRGRSRRSSSSRSWQRILVI